MPADRIPDRAEHQRRFMALDFSERRAIVRAVNRGQALEDRQQAALAVGLARRQERFWRWAWLLGPALGLLQTFFQPLAQALANTLVATVGLALIAWWFLLRARRAEDLNLAVVQRRAPEVGTGRGSWRPRRAAAAATDVEVEPDPASADPDERSATPPRGPRPRGRKRR